MRAKSLRLPAVVLLAAVVLSAWYFTRPANVSAPGHQARIGAIPGSHGGPRLLALASLWPAGRAGARAHLVNVTSATGLAIPWTSWPQSTTRQFQGNVTPAQLDSASNLMSFVHTKTYSSLGAQGGIAQQGVLPVGTSDGAAELWLATYYDTPEHAAAVVADVAATLGSVGLTATPCGGNFPNCYLAAFTIFGQNGVDVDYFIFAQANVVGELAMSVDAAGFNANTASVNNAFSALSQAALKAVLAAVGGTPQANPALPPSIGVDWVVLTVKSKGADKPVKKVSSRATAYFIAAFHGANAGSATPSATLTIVKKGKTILSKPMTAEVSPNSLQYFVYVVKRFPKAAAGALTAKFSLTLGSATSTKSLKFSVTPAKS